MKKRNMLQKIKISLFSLAFLSIIFPSSSLLAPEIVKKEVLTISPTMTAAVGGIVVTAELKDNKVDKEKIYSKFSEYKSSEK